ncbi:branched-chain amino acid transporter [candidate division KSB3 bacterium]|uniref:Branched-chain amino acid transporter n=1 Tax=candidate division KSB3 bacterium TaxID=2044937 RepID=A0A2G6EAY6_9BACT|nr:MAG: branched-chain amino acid transporter [candidate division KSB3 bacterium]PIE30979.1 MAG: branched-chain amino acid transporter [candidate division KSB3 bacterium]
MLSPEMFILLVGMSVVTALARVLPLVFSRVRLDHYIREWLEGIPYAALAALIFPAILHIDAHNLTPGLIGGGVAVLLSFWKLPAYLVVIAAVIAVALYQLSL